MLIKVKRRENAPKITSFSAGDFKSLQFSADTDEFEIPIIFLESLKDFFEPFFPTGQQERQVAEFMLGSVSKKKSAEDK